MRNKLTDLNDYLFEQIERINDDSLTPEQLESEMTRAEAVSKIATVIVQNGKLQLDAVKFAAEYGIAGGENIPSLFLNSGGKKGGGHRWQEGIAKRSTSSS